MWVCVWVCVIRDTGMKERGYHLEARAVIAFEAGLMLI
jgi:hypothetical protein